MVGLGKVRLAQGPLDGAVRWLEKAQATDGTAVGPQLALIGLHLRKGDAAKALDAANRLSRTAADDYRAVQALGQVQAAAGNRQAAPTTFRHVGFMSETNTSTLTTVAQTQVAPEDVEGARDSLAAATVHDPEHIPAQVALITLDLFEKRTADALDRARALAARFDEAVLASDEAFEREPGPAVRIKRVRVLWQAGRSDQALKAVGVWVAQEPDSMETKRQLAGAYLSADQLDRAQRLHEQLLEHVPNNVDLMNNTD